MQRRASTEKTLVFISGIAMAKMMLMMTMEFRSHKRSIAAPLSLGVKGLKNNLEEEGLFRLTTNCTSN